MNIETDPEKQKFYGILFSMIDITQWVYEINIVLLCCKDYKGK